MNFDDSDELSSYNTDQLAIEQLIDSNNLRIEDEDGYPLKIIDYSFYENGKVFIRVMVVEDVEG